MLISRFLIDLQDANKEMTHGRSELSSLGTLQFRVIGALGSSLPAPGEASQVDIPHSSVVEDNDEDREFV